MLSIRSFVRLISIMTDLCDCDTTFCTMTCLNIIIQYVLRNLQ